MDNRSDLVLFYIHHKSGHFRTNFQNSCPKNHRFEKERQINNVFESLSRLHDFPSIIREAHELFENEKDDMRGTINSWDVLYAHGGKDPRVFFYREKSRSAIQPDLFEFNAELNQKYRSISDAIDEIDTKLGEDTVIFGLSTIHFLR